MIQFICQVVNEEGKPLWLLPAGQGFKYTIVYFRKYCVNLLFETSSFYFSLSTWVQNKLMD